jgi:BlaI family penicillinase repressor
MSKKTSAPTDLSPAQREIMEIVWERGEISVSDARDILSRKREVARNTVRTLLERMELKGWLTHREDRRQFLYSAVVPRQASIGRRVIDMLNSVCGGSPETLMTALLDHRGLSADELQRIEIMLNSAKNHSAKGTKR